MNYLPHTVVRLSPTTIIDRDTHIHDTNGTHGVNEWLAMWPNAASIPQGAHIVYYYVLILTVKLCRVFVVGGVVYYTIIIIAFHIDCAD